MFTYMHIHTDISLNPLLPPHMQHARYVSTHLQRPSLDLWCRYDVKGPCCASPGLKDKVEFQIFPE